MRVPASSANLGAGFDTLALALEIFLEASAGPRQGGPRVSLSGPEVAGLPTDESNLVWQAFARAFQSRGKEPPDWSFHLYNEIPLGRGLGSSGAAAVAGVALANRAGDLGLDPLRILALAAEMEGHPDNVAASTLGGLAVVARRSDSEMEALALPWPAEVGVLVAIPDCRLPTEKARAVLPPSYSRADAVFNLQRAALFVAAVLSRQVSALRTALEDRFHQPYRRALVPGLEEALELGSQGSGVPGLLGVALSGAGPALVAFVSDPGPTRAALEALYARLKIPCQVRSLAVAPAGVRYSGFGDLVI